MSADDHLWLLEIEGAGQVLRWSSETIEVTDADGVDYVYREGLSDLQLAAGDEQVDVQILDQTTRWPSLARSLHTATATLRRWRVGTLLDTAETYARGRVGELEHGAVGEAASFTIDDRSEAPVLEIPDATSVVSAETWPASSGWETNRPAVGQYYPIVFGQPGFLSELAELTGETFPGSTVRVVPVPHPRISVPPYPGGLTGDPWYVISEDPSTCQPETVYLGDGTGANTNWAYEVGSVGITHVVVTPDALGKAVVTASAGPNGEAMPDPEAQVFAAYPPGAGIRTAYEVIAYVLGRWTADTVDWSRLPEVEALLSDYQVDTWIAELFTDGAWEWVRGLIEHMPVEIRVGLRGWYLQRKWVRVDPSRTLRALSVDLGQAARVSGVTWSSATGPYSVLRVLYADLQGSGVGLDYWSRVTYGPEAAAAMFPGGVFGLDEVRSHGLLAAARALGIAASHEIELPWTWDRRTAGLVAEYQIERDALQHRRVSYLVPERLGLREGDQIELTDSELEIEATLAIVDAPPLVGGGGATIELRIPEGIGGG